ncbi:G-protein-signaling modulator 3 [Hemicordylus capensis]|uniref:G-protein-signaling modulator 3 n=1 Tax=Hemicordylus capensis TaxID=884348 RepID=UPI0023043572|nr:G-protein-signaling modulator 3 [Hemicordylus capensis]XP_053147663.1 G-protein-signaling modulator 3 [Hemicordylus capensis]XP_053147664.1 G-protein-signaling modulator 3 [Hemicordylus capensis]XP_053147665.1 G-protein-signaling modulator 3 [Hemicordylus capensis]XP_053147666.1 G-protein-signaling modulator 3 [Hemicordylus capensis]XP_053147667.1 G-protein-signaling modulator 3 [Hemicordylus capensis]XP_053147668.1 G-protein-signaling modulator 3 [Hemicordylus capensis]XP_053147669.1 G-p
MDEKMEVLEEGEMVLAEDLDVQTIEKQVFFQDVSNKLPSQNALPYPRQRTRRPDPARPWKSLPTTPTGETDKAQPVFFSSLTSLQAEEFFDMVAKVQARRLNDQRADFAAAEDAGAAGESVVPEQQLYDTILAHQSQRLEDQRTEPPIPVGIQGLLDLLLAAQGTRMEDQRSVLPPALATPSLLKGQCVNPPPDPFLGQLWFS